jgi:hypothetical protein
MNASKDPSFEGLLYLVTIILVNEANSCKNLIHDGLGEILPFPRIEILHHHLGHCSAGLIVAVRYLS